MDTSAPEQTLVERMPAAELVARRRQLSVREIIAEALEHLGAVEAQPALVHDTVDVLERGRRADGLVDAALVGHRALRRPQHPAEGAAANPLAQRHARDRVEEA